MPYYPEDQSEENLKKIRRNSVCALCGRQLYIYLDRETKKQYLACPTPGHEGISRKYEPPREDYESNIRRETELENEHGHETSRALATIPKQGQLSQSQAEHILSLVYPGCPREEIIRCAILCRDFGLHPLLKEVYLIPFKDKTGKDNYATVLGINATRKLMAQRGTFSYMGNTPRVMTEEEQIDIFGAVDDKSVVAITKLRTREGEEAQGYGRWPKDKEPYGTDKGNNKANMAFIRSERNAFGRLFTDAIPQNVEVIDEAYAELPDDSKIDKVTSEIIEGEARELPPEEKQKSKAKVKAKAEPTELSQEPEPEPAEKDETAITPEQIQDIHQLIKDNDMDLAAIGKYCNVDKGWHIRDLKDLKRWQYNEIVVAFEKGKT